MLKGVSPAQRNNQEQAGDTSAVFWLVASFPQHLLSDSTRQSKAKLVLSFEQVVIFQVKAVPKFRERKTGRKISETLSC